MKITRARLVKVLLVGMLMAAPVVVWTQRWNIHDSLRLRGYVAPQQIKQLSADTTMNAQSQRIFYVYHPELNEKEAFNANCKTSERTIVLGCYVSGTGIYLFAVNDVRLQGVLQVTAAHEMLHAAYERLGSNDRRMVESILKEAYDQLADERIRKTIDDYRRNGADVINELHSILGTEVQNLPPKLEEYYTRYFDNRLAVVSYSQKYEQAFTERKNKIADYDVQLDDLKQKIDQGEKQLAALSDNLQSERARLDGLLAEKQYESYNAEVSGYNNQVNAYNAQVREVRTFIETYNRLVAERNAIATEEGELVKAIDSRPETIPSQ